MTRTIEIPVEEYVSLRNKAMLLELALHMVDTAEYDHAIRGLINLLKPFKCELDIHCAEEEEAAKNDNF